MNILKRWCSVLLFVVLNIQYVSAQSDSLSSFNCVSCMCKEDATPAGVMISHVHPKGELMLSYRYMNMAGRGLQDNGTSISNDQVYNQYLMSSDRMHMDMHMLMAMYGLTRKITLMAMFDYNSSSMNMKSPSGSSHMMMMDGVMMMMPGGDMPDMKSSGFGDVKITGLYSLLDNVNHHVLVSAGISVPTGSIQTKGNASSMYPGSRMPYMMQHGSGTWDVLPGLTYTFQKNKIIASSQVYSTIRTGYNVVGYKLGNAISFNDWFAYHWLKWLSTSLRGEVNVTGPIKGSDPSLYIYNDPSANYMNYGGTSAWAHAGVNTYFKTGFINNKIGIEFGLPVYQNSNGIQPALYYSTTFNYSIVF